MVSKSEIEEQRVKAKYSGKITPYIKKQLEKRAVEAKTSQKETIKPDKKKSGKRILKTIKRDTKYVGRGLATVSERYRESQIVSEVKKKPTKKKPIKRKPAKKKPKYVVIEGVAYEVKGTPTKRKSIKKKPVKKSKSDDIMDMMMGQ